MSPTRALSVSLAPHGHSGRTLRGLILTTLLALVPAWAWGIYQFGWPALVLPAIAMAAAAATEALINRIAGQALTVGDGHAALVGLTVGLLLPAGAPWWMALVAAILAIAVGKAPFGPLGGAPLSPALVGLLIVAISWPAEMQRHVVPRTSPAALRSADLAPPEEPQTAFRLDPSDALEYRALELFLGHQVGRIGTVSPLLLLLGGLFLIARRAARWQGPAGFLAGLWLTAAVTHYLDPGHYPAPEIQAFSGIAMFGAFFLCAEWTCTPVTARGLVLFGLIAGSLAVVLRLAGVPCCRVPFAIVLTSLGTPLLDRLAVTPFGKGVRHA